MGLEFGSVWPKFDPDRDALIFDGLDGSKRVTFIVSKEALNDRSGLYETGERLIAIFAL